MVGRNLILLHLNYVEDKDDPETMIRYVKLDWTSIYMSRKKYYIE